MPGALRAWCGGRRLLVLVAAEIEARALLAGLTTTDPPLVPVPPEWSRIEATGTLDLIRTGVGKTNAAAAAARFLDPARHAGVLSVGIAGALPGSGLLLGDAVLAEACVYADEGVQSDTGFRDLPAMGFPLGPFAGSAAPTDAALTRALAADLASAEPAPPRVGRVATVSTCSGTDALAAEVARRTGAIAEAMEGAAIAHVAARLGVPAGELRVISNTTGSRATQRWDIPLALARLRAIAARLHA
jgi:futalosine hydrolase